MVVIENVALDEPDGMATLVGTDASPGFELDNPTVTPPGGATPFSDTVPNAVLPPWMYAGTLMLLRDGSRTVMD